MGKIQRATPRADMTSNGNTTRLPLALKPSNITVRLTSPTLNETLPQTTINMHKNSAPSSTNQPSSISASSTSETIASSSTSPLPQKIKSSSNIKKSDTQATTKKKKKTVSKHVQEISDDGSDDEANYDLATCIDESGGLAQFLKTPCMVLYKHNLRNQIDLEDYVLQHLSTYKENPCLFPGVKGTDVLKNKINQFFNQHRRKSMSSTILFKATGSKTTLTQQILLQNGNLYLYVDNVMKNKTARNKKKRVFIENSGFNRGRTYIQFVDKNDEKEKLDVENVDGGASGDIHDTTAELSTEDENEEKEGIDEDEIANEETSQIRDSTGGKKSRPINWKGGSKNCGFYMMYHKRQEVRECINNVLSYGRDHGVLLTGVQLKTLFDIQNVEITKERANSLVHLIASSIEIVNNPHFIPPMAQRPVYEFYGENYELGVVSPTKCIPVPRTIVEKYKNKKDEKPVQVMNKGNDDSQTYSSENNNKIIEPNDEELTEDDDTSSTDNKEDEKEESKEINNNSTKEDSNVKGGNDKNTSTSIGCGMVCEESTNSDIISSELVYLKEAGIDNNNHSNNNIVIISKRLEGQVQDIDEQCFSTGADKAYSSITINSNSKSQSLSTSFSKSIISDSNQAILTDVIHSNSQQHSVIFDNTTKTSTPKHSNIFENIDKTPPLEQQQIASSLEQKQITPPPLEEQQITPPPLEEQQITPPPLEEQQITPSQPKKNIIKKGIKNRRILKDNNRRSFGLRSRTKTKQPQQQQRRSSDIEPTKRKVEGACTVQTERPCKKKKSDNTTKTTTNYQILTKNVGKIPKQTTKSSTTIPSNENK